MLAKLSPIYGTRAYKDGDRVKSVENVMCYITGYPVFMAHVDLVWDACKENGDYKMYEALQAGETVEVEISIKPA